MDQFHCCEPTENDEQVVVYEGYGTGGDPVENRRGQREGQHLVTEDDNPHDPDEMQIQKQLRCKTERTASHSDYLSDSQSSAGLSGFRWCHCREECEKYKLRNRCEIFDGELKTFWETIERDCIACEHIKNWFLFEKAMSEKFPKLPNTTSNALKIIFNIQEKTHPTQLTVELDDFLLLAKCFGTFSTANGTCPMLNNLQEVLRKSATKVSRTAKISWFAGKMTRDEAEQRLENREEGTFLVRLSETQFGKFALSVVLEKGANPLHMDLEFQEDDGGGSIGACSASAVSRFVKFGEQRYYSLHAIVNEYFMKEYFDEDHPDLICSHVCPDLPFNRIVTGYKSIRK